MLEGPFGLHPCGEDSALQKAQSQDDVGTFDLAPRCKLPVGDPGMSLGPPRLTARLNSSHQGVPKSRSASLEARDHRAKRKIQQHHLLWERQLQKGPSSRSDLKGLF